MKNVVAYCRYSSDNQRVESISAQIRAIKEFCKKNNYNLVKIYADEAISGTSTEDREEFLQMIEDSKLCNFECVIVHKFAHNRMVVRSGGDYDSCRAGRVVVERYCLD